MEDKYKVKLDTIRKFFGIYRKEAKQGNLRQLMESPKFGNKNSERWPLTDQVYTNIGFINDFHQGRDTFEVQHKSYLAHFHKNDLEQPPLPTFKRRWADSGGFR